MAKKAKVNTPLDVTSSTKEKIVSPTLTSSASVQNISQPSTALLFGAINYKLMIAGLAIIFLGFILMMGVNNTASNANFPAEEIYSVRRIIIAPIVIIIGFMVELYAIIILSKK